MLGSLLDGFLINMVTMPIKVVVVDMGRTITMEQYKPKTGTKLFGINGNGICMYEMKPQLCL